LSPILDVEIRNIFREAVAQIEEEGVHGKGRGGLGTTQSYRAHPRDEF